MDEPLPARCRVSAWRPAVPGIAEVFHARIVDYAYPLHVHDTWTVLIVDDGAIDYDLDRRSCGASPATVAVLPPGVVHNGRPAAGAPAGFRKRNLYLDPTFLPAALVGRAVDRTTVVDPALRAALAALHDGLAAGSGPLDAEARLALIGERIADLLAPAPAAPRRPESAVADRLRDLLDAHLTAPLPLREAAAILGRSVPHLVRSFTRRHGLSPHAYVLGRRVEAARSRLLAGERPADVAVELGFHDQAHLTRHFRRHTATTPGRYARGRRPAAQPP